MNLKNYTLLLMLAASIGAHAQKQVSKSNVLIGPFFKTIHTGQEMKIGERFSTQTTAKVRPASSFGGKRGTVEVSDGNGNTYNPFTGLKMSSVGNVTEFRIYGKEKGALRGFYWGPYASYNYFKLASDPVRADFQDENNVTYSGDVSQVVKVNVGGGGIQFGTQGVFLKDRLVVDWTILGVGFGMLKLSGGLEATNTSENFDFRNYDEDVDNISFGVDKLLKIEKTVEKESVVLSAKVPVPMFRMGLSVGFAYGKGLKKKNKDGGSDAPAIPATPTPGGDNGGNGGKGNDF